MTVDPSTQVQATQAAVDIKQANAKLDSKENACRAPRGGAELEYPGEYPGDINEEQTITEPDYASENACVNKPAPGFEQVTVPVKTLESACEQEAEPSAGQAQELRPFSHEETFFIFDWDDTVLPSAWVQGQGLRLDEDSKVSESQRQQLNQVANVAIETLQVAKQHGTVVLVTNAERGWIELSCQKFMPSLYPVLENVKLLSARTTYESPALSSPLEWKLRAFESEIVRVFGAEDLSEPSRRKNILSLGDSMHEREALLRATAAIPNCRSKSLKFVERPDIGQICKQHSLITGCFDRIVHHDGNLDLCIRCN
jgi:hypothetical protein